MTAQPTTAAAQLAERVAAAGLPARVTIDPLGPDVAEITDLIAPERGRGKGRETLRAVIALSEELGVALEAWPVVDDAVDDGLGLGALRDWYARLGFREIPNRDLEDRPDFEFDRHLVREPRRTK